MKKWKIALLILLIFGIGISVYVYNSQKKEKIAWDKAQKKNTISAYEEFLEKYPKSKFAYESRSRIEALKKERHPWFRDVKKAKIIIEEKFYIDRNGKYVSIDTSPITLWLEEFVGINVIKNKHENSDMIVRVKVSGQIRGAWYYGYRPFYTQFAYTGGAINGTISFEVGSNKIEEGFRGEKELESVITKGSWWEDPESALSAIMGRSSFNEKIAILVYRAFGLTPLISALKSGNLAAPGALGKLKDPRAVEPLIEALKDEDLDVRESAADALGELRDPRAVEPLIEALKDKYWPVRERAVKALEKINPKWRETEEAKKWVPVFISDLKSKSLDTRKAAVYALGELRDPRAVEPLIEALKDKDWSVRKRAVEALGKLKDPRAVEPLIEALKDEVWNVRRSAADALQEITGQHFGRDPEKWQKWWEENKGRFINRTQ